METFNRRGRDFLAFAATPWNAGPAPLVVEGFRRPGEELMDAYQYFRDADGVVTGRAAGRHMRYHPHPAHDHWHFLQFAQFTLHDAADLEVVRSESRPTAWLPPTPSTSRSSARAGDRKRWPLDRPRRPRRARVREVLQVGWGDTYFQFVPGQSFNITSLSNGWYHARVHVNPLGSLYETDMSNVSSRVCSTSAAGPALGGSSLGALARDRRVTVSGRGAARRGGRGRGRSASG